jgi:hypothetical protein
MSPMQRKRMKVGRSFGPKQSFTLGQANRALVLVRRIVGDVMSQYGRLVDLQETLETAEAAGDTGRYETARRGLARSAGRLRTFLGELEDVGVELEDWELGVVHFPSIAGGRQVCLCWQYGEEEITCWHEVDAGPAGRQPLETLPREGNYLAEGDRRTKPASRVKGSIRKGAATDPPPC